MNIFTPAILLLATIQLHSKPYRPDNESAVLEVLPRSLVQSDSWRQARRQIAENPANKLAALHLAESYLQTAQRTSDARYVSFARGVLRSQLQETNPAPDVRYLRAIIRQHEHDFSGALADLDVIIEAAPNHNRALLVKASILMTLGHFEEARPIFQKHLALIRDLNGLAVFCQLTSLTGGLKQSYDLLQQQLLANPGAATPTRCFVLTTLGELAVRQGLNAQAESRFNEALTLEPDNSYLLAAWSNLMLQSGRVDAVLQKIEPNPASDALLLRRLLAEVQAGKGGDRSRFLSAKDTFHKSGHLRELALLQLRCLRDPESALQNALCNWETQRELIDASLVLEAAVASGNPQAAADVLAWLERNKIEDVRLTRQKIELRHGFTGPGFTESELK